MLTLHQKNQFYWMSTLKIKKIEQKFILSISNIFKGGNIIHEENNTLWNIKTGRIETVSCECELFLEASD